MNRVDRRTFLKGFGAVSAVTAASTSVPTIALSASTLVSRESAGATTWNRAPCRLCGVGCGLLIGTSAGRAVGVRGDTDSPVSHGLACARGYYSVEALTGSERLTRALIRRDGALVPVPLATALDLVARRLGDTMQRHGKDSVAMYGSAQWDVTDAYLASKLFKGALGAANLDTSARLYGASQRAGLQASFGLDGVPGCYEDIDHADVFVLWDINLAETDPVLFSRILDRKRINPGVRIIDVATRTSRTSYASDHTLLHAPHAALVIANAICSEIVERQWVDREFVDRHVAFKRGRSDLGAGAGGGLVADDPAAASWNDYINFLDDYTPDRAQALSGLSAASIRWLASLYGDPLRKVVSVWGRDLSQDARGTWANTALNNVHLLVGKVAAPGNGVLALSGQPEGCNGASDAGSMAETLPGGLVRNGADRQKAAEIWGVPVERIPSEPGLPLLGMFQALERGDVRFLWILATDPMLSLPNAERYRRAATQADRFIVVSEAYPTPTTEIADVVLPAAMWLERDGVMVNAERRVQYFGRQVNPPGEAMGDGWQMIEVARRLGFGTLFPYDRARVVEQVWDEYARFHEGPGRALPPLTELRARPGVLWPFVNGQEVRWRYNAVHDPVISGASEGFDFYGHADHRAWIWLRPYEGPAEAPDSEYPFWLTTGGVLEHWGTGTMTRRIPELQRALPHAYVELSREDARGLGIRNRDRVRLVSRRGSLEAEVRIDYRSQPPRGLVFVPGFDAGVPVQRLTLDTACPISGQPDAVRCAVRVERLPVRAGS